MSACNLRDYRRLLASPFGVNLLRVDLALDIYVRNPFRIIVTPAWVDDTQRDTTVQRFRNLYKLRPEAAMKNALRIGYEELADIHNPLKLLDDLRDPQRRLIWELFWLHLKQEEFNCVANKGVLTIPKNDLIAATCSSQEKLNSTLRFDAENYFANKTADNNEEHKLETLQNNHAAPVINQENNHAQELDQKDNINATLRNHALAILHHNRALAIELSITNILTEPPRARAYRNGADNHWRKSLEYWAATKVNPIFWEYLTERIKLFDDPQLKPSYLEQLRDELPSVILAFNAIFVRAYVGANCMEDAARHMRIISNNPFHLPVQRTVMLGLARDITNAWLNPLIQQLENQRPRELISWQAARDWLVPIIEAAEKLPAEVKEKFGVDEMIIAETQFDNLVEKVLTGISSKIIDYQQSYLKALLFAIIICKKILNLPLSASLRRKIEERYGDYNEMLYGRFFANPHQARQIDPTECWFVPGERVDPEISILLPVYKITSTKGKTVLWTSQEVLIPRSRLAETLFLGNTTEINEQRQAEIEKINKMIAEINAEIAKDQQNLEQHCAAAIAQEEAYCQARIQKFNAEVAPEETQLKQQIQEVESMFLPRFNEVEQRLTTAQTAAFERWAPALTTARQKLENFAPFKRWIKINLPITSIISGVMALIISSFFSAYTLIFYYLSSLELSIRKNFHASDQIINTFAVIVSIILIFILTMFLTEIILLKKSKNAQKLFNKISERQAEALKWINHVINQQREEILCEQESKIKEQRSKLAVINEQRTTLTQEMNQIIADIINRHQQEIAYRQIFDKRLIELKQLLDSYQTPVKHLDSKIDFPVYLEALKNGYLPGERPPKLENKPVNKPRRTPKLWPF